MRKPDQPSNAGNLEEVADWGRLFLGYFLLATQKKVTSCRAASGGFGRDRVLFDLIRGFQVEFLKIDGSVILNLLQDPVTLAKVRAVSGVAKKIGVKTVAEFVESEEIITRLKEIGIDYAQGFGISRPRPLVE